MTNMTKRIIGFALAVMLILVAVPFAVYALDLNADSQSENGSVTGTNDAAYVWNQNNGFEAGGHWLIFGQAGPMTDPTESFVLKVLGEGGKLLATTELMDVDGIYAIETTELSWHITIGTQTGDDYWKTTWESFPRADEEPENIEMWIDGVLCTTTPVTMGHPDFANNAVTWANVPGVAVAEADGVYYNTLGEAIENAAEGTVINLLGNVSEKGSEAEAGSGEFFVQIIGNKNITINFNGNTFSGSFYVDNTSSAVFENGTVTTLLGNASSGVESVGGSVEFTDMTVFTTARHAVRVKGGSAIFNGGHYETRGTGTMHAVNISHASTVIINDGTFVGPKGYSNAGGNAVMIADSASSVAVNGGLFKNAAGSEGPICAAQGLVISGGTFEDTVSSFRYHSFLSKDKNYIALTRSEGVYEVVEVTNWIEIADTNWYNGNDTEFTLTTAEQLAGLAALVNGGNKFAGKTIYLGANIDLAGLYWTPIGNSSDYFSGNFDGNNFTVSNLSINESAKSHQALFGNIKGSSESSYPFVSNLTLTNVNVVGKSYVAGIVADAFCIDIIGCHVNGDIYILNVGNNNYTGAIAGHSYANILNCSVKDTGTDGNGRIQGCYSGGIAGWTGEGKYLIENCTVENIDFVEESGTIAGLFNAGVMIKDCSAENCTIDSNTGSGLGYCGLIAGDNRSHAAAPNYIINCKLENVTGQVTVSGASQPLTQLVPPKASTYIGYDVTFDTDPDAVKVGTSKFIGGTFETRPLDSVIADGYTVEEIDGKFVIVFLAIAENETTGEVFGSLQEAIDAANAGEKITLLANIFETGITVSADQTVVIDLNGFTVNGDFMVYGTAAIKNGTVVNNNVVSCVESNGAYADLTLENITATSNRHAIRIDGGKAHIISGIYTSTASGISAYAINIGGDIETFVVIDGGEFYASENASTQGTAVVMKNALCTVEINGGIFNTASDYSIENYGNLTVTGGTFNGAIVNNDRNITGGKFTVEPANYVAKGYVALKNGDLFEIAEENAEIKHYGNSVSFDDILYINKYVTIGGLNPLDYTMEYITSNGGMLIWNEIPEEVIFDAAFAKANLVYNKNGIVKYTQQSNGIVAKDISKDFYFCVYLRLEDGSYAYGELQTYSVKAYCETILAKEGASEQSKNMARATLAYGAYAQEYFGYNNDGLVLPENKFEEGLLTPATPADTSALTNVSDVKNYVLNKSVSFDDILKLNFFYTLSGEESYEIDSAVLQIWSGTSVLTENNFTSKEMKFSGGKWTAQTDGIVAKEFGKTVYIRAMFVDTDGNEHYSDVFAYSVENYAADIIAKSSNPNMVEFAKSAVVYGEAVKEYLASLGRN